MARHFSRLTRRLTKFGQCKIQDLEENRHIPSNTPHLSVVLLSPRTSQKLEIIPRQGWTWTDLDCFVSGEISAFRIWYITRRIFTCIRNATAQPQKQSCNPTRLLYLSPSPRHVAVPLKKFSQRKLKPTEKRSHSEEYVRSQRGINTPRTSHKSREPIRLPSYLVMY